MSVEKLDRYLVYIISAAVVGVSTMAIATVSSSNAYSPPSEGVATELAVCSMEVDLLRREALATERKLVELCGRGVIDACPEWRP